MMHHRIWFSGVQSVKRHLGHLASDGMVKYLIVRGGWVNSGFNMRIPMARVDLFVSRDKLLSNGIAFGRLWALHYGQDCGMDVKACTSEKDLASSTSSGIYGSFIFTACNEAFIRLGKLVLSSYRGAGC